VITSGATERDTDVNTGASEAYIGTARMIGFPASRATINQRAAITGVPCRNVRYFAGAAA